MASVVSRGVLTTARDCRWRMCPQVGPASCSSQPHRLLGSERRRSLGDARQVYAFGIGSLVVKLKFGTTRQNRPPELPAHFGDNWWSTRPPHAPGPAPMSSFRKDRLTLHLTQRATRRGPRLLTGGG